MNQVQVKKLLININLVLDTIGWSLLIPILPSLNATLGINVVYAGWITSAVSVAGLLSGFAQCLLSDVIGATNMLRLSVGTQIIGFMIMLFALETKSVPLYVLARCLPSLFKCGMVMSQALLYEFSSPSEYTTDIGILQSFSSIAYTIGPGLGGRLFASFGYRIFYVGIGCCLISLGILAISNTTTARPVVNSKDTSSFEHSAEKEKPPLSANSNLPKSNAALTTTTTYTSLTHYLHIKFAFQLGNTCFEFLFSQHAVDQFRFSVESVGYLVSYCSLLSAVTTSIILPWLTRKVGGSTKTLLPILAVSLPMGLAYWALASDPVSVVLSCSVVTMSTGIFLCILQSLIAGAHGQSSHPRSDQDNSTHTGTQAAKSHMENGGSNTAQTLPELSTVNGNDDDNHDASSMLDTLSSPVDTMSNLFEMRNRRPHSEATEKQTGPRSEVRTEHELVGETVADCTTSTQSISHNTSSPKRSSFASVMGISSMADRAARIISPTLSAYAKPSDWGLVWYSFGVMVYVLSLLYIESRFNNKHIEHLAETQSDKLSEQTDKKKTQ